MAEQNYDRFPGRKRLLAARDEAKKLAEIIRGCIPASRSGELLAVIADQHPADLADAMYFLSDEEDRIVFEALTIYEAAEVIGEVDGTTRAALAKACTPAKLAEILDVMPPDEGVFVLSGLASDRAERALVLVSGPVQEQLKKLLAYPKDSAGRVMSTGYVSVNPGSTARDALDRYAEMFDGEHLFFVYVVDEVGALKGLVDLRTLLKSAPDSKVGDYMFTDVVTVEPNVDQERVSHIFIRYDLTALPVVEAGTRRMLGVVTSEDVIEILQEESAEDVAHLTGTDADELEKKSPATIAKMRIPWILATMFIELLAGLVIHKFDKTLTKVILLASFMPIISAISGNTGLQSAAIIIRGLSTGHVDLVHWKHAVGRQLGTTVILGAVCGVVLGIIGSIWDHSLGFGIVVSVGMFMSVNIAGAVGTVIPLLSKRMGYDPALTAGPFETAFQDVVGISIFLTLATLLLPLLN